MTTDLSKYDASVLPSADVLGRQRYAIIVADWNPEITFALCQGAVDTFLKHGVPGNQIDIMHVPGTVELTYGAACAMDYIFPKSVWLDHYVAIVVIGCGIRGGTPHFDYVCQSVTEGVAQLNARGTVPVIFSVLTCDDMQQALDRAGGKLGNKGVEGAFTAMKMANIKLESWSNV